MKRREMYGLKQRAMRLALASALAFFGTPSINAVAGTDTSNMAVSATVSANCTITAGALAFGAYDPVSANASADLDQTATLTVNCTSGSAATITLGQGANADASSTDAAPLRRMKDSATNYLSYSLFSDTGRATVWGNDATTDVAYSGTGADTTVSVYGRVDAGQNVPAGSYSDTVVATITF